ncbi:MAG: hypothetical protein H7Y11_00120 [Armatimonadetes bacterium]|nr:hypothetical protein [Anaerolineae bacterium]
MALTTLIHDQLLDFLVDKATPQEILAFRMTDAAQLRAETLTVHNKTRTLTPDEAAELEQMIALDLLLGALKARALKVLHHRLS